MVLRGGCVDCEFLSMLGAAMGFHTSLLLVK